MKIRKIDGKEVETMAVSESDMKSSIVNTMRRYFQNDTGGPRPDLEYAIMDSVKRYFESPRH